VEATLRVLIRRILVQILAAYLVLFVLAVACFWILNSLQQNRISRSLTLVTRESLVVRDLRQVIINLDQFVGNQFYSVLTLLICRFSSCQRLQVLLLRRLGIIP
jgi:hypothetical protein